MSLHANPEHNLPQIVEGLKKHHLVHDKPSQLADAFRTGFLYARSQFLLMGKEAGEASHRCIRCYFDYTPLDANEDCPHCGCDGNIQPPV